MTFWIWKIYNSLNKISINYINRKEKTFMNLIYYINKKIKK